MSFPDPYVKARMELERQESSPGRKPATDLPVAILGGMLLLATIILPILGPAGTLIWSWDILSHAPGGTVAFFVVSWLVGACAVGFNAALKGLALSIVNLVLAVVIVILVVWLFMSPLGRVLLGFASVGAVLRTLQVLSLAAFLVITGVRTRLPQNTPTCNAQVVISGIFAGVSAIVFLVVMAQLGQIRSGVGAVAAWLFLLAALALLAMLAASGVLGLMHGLNYSSAGAEATGRARVMAVAAVLSMVGLVLVLPLFGGVFTIWVLPLWVVSLLSPVSFLLGLGVVFLEGFTSFISEVGAWSLSSGVAREQTRPQPPPQLRPPVPPSGQPSQPPPVPPSGRSSQPPPVPPAHP